MVTEQVTLTYLSSYGQITRYGLANTSRFARVASGNQDYGYMLYPSIVSQSWLTTTFALPLPHSF